MQTRQTLRYCEGLNYYQKLGYTRALTLKAGENGVTFSFAPFRGTSRDVTGLGVGGCEGGGLRRLGVCSWRSMKNR